MQQMRFLRRSACSENDCFKIQLDTSEHGEGSPVAAASPVAGYETKRALWYQPGSTPNTCGCSSLSRVTEQEFSLSIEEEEEEAP
jgi:hypothetical protein